MPSLLLLGGSGMPGSNSDQGNATLRFGPRRRHGQEKFHRWHEHRATMINNSCGKIHVVSGPTRDTRSTRERRECPDCRVRQHVKIKSPPTAATTSRGIMSATGPSEASWPRSASSRVSGRVPTAHRRLLLSLIFHDDHCTDTLAGAEIVPPPSPKRPILRI